MNQDKKTSIIFCLQPEVAGWYHKVGESTLADDIRDCVVHDSYSIVMVVKALCVRKKLHNLTVLITL